MTVNVYPNAGEHDEATPYVILQAGTLDKYGCELIGAKLPSINAAEDRELFRQAMVRIGLKTPPSGIVESMGDADRVQVRKQF